MLFKHGKAQSEDKPVVKKDDKPVSEEKKVEVPASSNSPLQVEPPKKDVSPEALRELLEKNLKWSQIIYEQNRKIKNALIWKAIASWLWFFVLVVLPTAGSFWLYANRDAFMKSLEQTMANVISQTVSSSIGSKGASKEVNVTDLLKLVPLSPEQQQQLKAVLGN
jgi:hypothetical protein